MIVRCGECGRVYDDAEFLTICPHELHVSGGSLCRRHDLFRSCRVCELEAAKAEG